MDRAHDVQEISLVGTTLRLRVDGAQYEVDILKHSKRLAAASPEQRAKFEVSPSGYGIHWPEVDEDLSIDGLIGIKRLSPLAQLRQ